MTAKENTITVFGDFNCPFCYALNERLQVYGREMHIEWREIQHVPNIDSRSPSFQEQTQLTSEVSAVRKRAPEVLIVTPPSRPNSALAAHYVAAVQERDPLAADNLRNLIYRALWRHGEDISEPELLAALAHKVGIGDVRIGERHEALVRRWQQAWEEGNFDLRIPCMENSAGARILGFPAIPRLVPFLQGQIQDEVLLDAVCEVRSQRRVLVVGSNVGLAQPVASEFVLDTASFDDDLELLSLEAGQADLVILDGTDDRHQQFCLRLQRNDSTQNIPVVVFNQQANSTQEVESFNMGALDYMHGDQDPVVWLARSRGLARHKQSTDMLGRMARIDGLTEIPNRREFDRMLEIEWLRSLRSKDPLSVLMMDVDNFKKYNDGYGHYAGDECLRQVAMALQTSTGRSADFAARYGGEEFVCILPDTDLEGAVVLGNTIRSNIEALNIPHEYADGRDMVTISVGAATCTASTQQSPVELIKAADAALFRAKEGGRNRVEAAE